MKKSEEADQDEEVQEETEPGSNEAVEFFEALNEEYDQNGGLSEESLDALKEMSSEELVDAYFQMQDRLGSEPQGAELSESDVSAIQQSVGGADNYNALVSWAAENFDQAEIEAFDGVVESGNVGAINLALQALYIDTQKPRVWRGNFYKARLRHLLMGSVVKLRLSVPCQTHGTIVTLHTVQRSCKN